MLSTVEFFGILTAILGLVWGLFTWQSRKIKISADENNKVNNSITALNSNYKGLSNSIIELNKSIKEYNDTNKEFTIAIVKFEMKINELDKINEKNELKFSEIWSQINELKK